MLGKFYLEKKRERHELYMAGYLVKPLATFSEKEFGLYIMNKLNTEKTIPIFRFMLPKKNNDISMK